MSKLVDEIVEQISIDKEIIAVSPKTGVKQIRAFCKKMEEMHAKYNQMYDDIITEITARYDRIDSIVENEEIDILNTITDKNAILVVNKLDLCNQADIIDKFKKIWNKDVVFISAKNQDGVLELKDKIFKYLEGLK